MNRIRRTCGKILLFMLYCTHKQATRTKGKYGLRFREDHTTKKRMHHKPPKGSRSERYLDKSRRMDRRHPKTAKPPKPPRPGRRTHRRNASCLGCLVYVLGAAVLLLLPIILLFA